MEPLRGTQQSLRSRRVASKSVALPDLRAQQPRAGHNSRKLVGTVVRTYRPGHEPRHRRQATIPSRRTPHYPEKRARAPAGASVPVAQDDGVKSSCDAACRREQGLLLGRIARGYCNRRSSRNQSNLGAPKRYGPTNCPELSSPPERGFARTPPWPRGSPGTPD